MTAGALLAVAERLLAAGGGWFACWPRVCALLLRTALESAMAVYWDGIGSAIGTSPMTHQLLVLAAYTDGGTAAEARAAWCGLSRAVHHHPYDLSPTITELTAWYTEVRDLVDRLTGPQGVPVER